MTAIDDLLALHMVDKQARGLRSRVENAQTFLNAQQRRLDELTSTNEELVLRSKTTRASAANLETEAGGVDERTNKLREDLKNSSTTKQYNAILEEINNLKESKSKIDDRALAELETIEQLESQIGELTSKIAERTKVRDTAKGELTERTSEVAEQLAVLEAERAQKASVVSNDVLVVFDKAADDFEGDSMAPLAEIDRRRMEYGCSCCNVSLPFNLVNTIMADGNVVEQCQGCLRILYVTEEVRGALVKK
ncbi:MAG: hypothetical protein CMJ24_07520 [Phycisphaerae bacterium]|nr:hypothetical protein [Phycisphaerae bacterium]MDG1899598.1 hypothetical protein [Phycisphaerales bacterium]|tara:strand:- start:7033 stop:7785 length:753 start_codon:yes stop_codon:yes gene_type:complete